LNVTTTGFATSHQGGETAKVGIAKGERVGGIARGGGT
jgi:hypothetical protein